MRIFDLGCGPAWEVQQFLAQDAISNHASFTFVDFNDETLEHVGTVLGDLKCQFERTTRIDLIKKSVHQVLKEEAKPGLNPPHYELIYCAGIFDYLSDRICKRLMNIFYSCWSPGDCSSAPT